MAGLPEDASLVEIENELAFYRAIIESMDPEEDDYEIDKERHEGTIQELQAMWDAKAPDDADASSTDSDLAESPIEHAPLPIRSRQPDSSRETSERTSKKRAYEPGSSPITARKISRQIRGQSRTGSPHSRASSADSLGEIERNFGRRIGRTLDDDFLQRAQRRAEKRAKARAERERRDAQMAQALQSEFDAQRSHTPFADPVQSYLGSSSQQARQSYLDSNAQIRTLPRRPPSPPQAEYSRDPLPLPPSQSRSDLVPNHAAVKDEPLPRRSLPWESGSTSDSSLEEINRNDFYALSSRSNAHPSQYTKMPPLGSIPVSGTSSAQQYQQYQPYQPYQPVSRSYPNGYQAHVPPQPPTMLDTARQSVYDALSSLSSFMPGSSKNAPISLDDPYSYLQYGRYGVPESYLTSGRRDLDYLYADPAKTKEEIDQLLANIRPDEELPESMREGSPPELKVPLMAHQKLGLAWLKQQEEGSNKGSILADDMGLGKTVQALALILTRPSEDPSVKTNLVIAPLALLRQWEREIYDKCKKKLKVYIYHGTKKNTTWAKLSTYDIVLTTYGTLATEWGRKSRHEAKNEGRSAASALKLVLLSPEARWYRVILDEAQYIKNYHTLTSVAATNLSAVYRLCMTGTPMMNNVTELYPYIRFLRIKPFNSLERFNMTFKRPLAENTSERTRQRAMQALQALLKAILLRRHKKSKIDGKPILQLPERFTEHAHTIFSPDEQEFYEHLEKSTQLQFNRYLKANTIGKNYSNILVLLLRLRQACCHPHLIKDHGIKVDADISSTEMEDLCRSLADNVVEMIKDAKGSFECPICYDAIDHPAILYPCGHDMCADCFSRLTDSSNAIAAGGENAQAKCPECRAVVDRKKIIDYTIFQKVHLPEVWAQEHPEEEGAEADDDADSGTESGSETDSGDSQGDLDDFIVNDDEEIAIEADSDNEISGTIKNEGESLDRKSRSSRAKIANVKSKGEQGRGKGKGKQRKVRGPEKTLAQLKKESMKSRAAKKKYLRRLRREWVTSAKVEKTMELLSGIREGDITEKTIVFSQFTSFLDLIEVPIDDQGWQYKRYDGSMSGDQRNQAVMEFADNPACNIMLVSLKAGNAGLNLNMASQVIILDPFWNPFIEEQAIDRAHRIGQTREVHVHRVLIQNTVEDRILALQEKKRALISEALDEKAGQSVTRLGARELRYLFGVDRELER